ADPAVLGPRDLVEAAVAAQEGGATAIQLRVKTAPAAELYHLARRLLERLNVPLFINDRADVALAAGACGVHLGQEDLPAAHLKPLVSSTFQIGLSVGTVTEAEIARRAMPNYWSIGPLYRTTSKADAGGPLGPPGFSRLARLAPSD